MHYANKEFWKENRILNIFILSALLIAGYKTGLGADDNKDKTIAFSEVWDRASRNSQSLKAAQYESKSADIAGKRSGRHWYPRIYGEDRVFRTNDPGQVFMMNLGQRSIQQSDFIPQTLNEPGHETVNMGTIGVDLPVYEGGAKSLGAKAMKNISEAKKYQQELVKIQVYVDLAMAYSGILISERMQKKLHTLRESIKEILARYELGSKANPIGYSGLLSLNALAKKIEVLKTANEAKILSMRKYIEENASISLSSLQLNDQSAVEFADRYLIAAGNISPGTSSYLIRSLDKIAAGQENMAEAERARFLPRLGIFSEANLYSGSRSTETSYNAGFYAQMNIFSASDYGALEQAKLTSSAARARAGEARVRHKSEVARLTAAGDASVRSIQLLTESMKIMDEQSATSLRLFANGTISALQLSDVFSRKADLIEGLSRAEDEYLNAKAGLLYYSDSNIILKNGDDYEKSDR